MPLNAFFLSMLHLFLKQELINSLKATEAVLETAILNIEEPERIDCDALITRSMILPEIDVRGS